MNSNIHYLFTVFFILVFTVLTCKDPEAEKKIDANLRMKIKTLDEDSQLDQTITIVFKSNEALTDLHREALQKKGIQIIANIGQIYTAKLPGRLLYDLAKMRFVESIQGSSELKIQPPDSTGKIQKF